MRDQIITDDGREYTAIEIGDVVPARGHIPGECVEGCWVCTPATRCTVCGDTFRDNNVDMCAHRFPVCRGCCATGGHNEGVGS